MPKKTIGVLAATPVDTGMGVAVVGSAGFPHVSRYLSTTPAEQSDLQIQYKDRLTEMVAAACIELAEKGADHILLYCNSLAGAVDMETVCNISPISIVTPLDVYCDLAMKYKSIALMTANGQSLAAIERIIQKSNPGCAVYGSGTLPITEAIEAGKDPAEIVTDLGIRELVQAFGKMGGEILVLACTHFPYFKDHIIEISTMPVIDPALAMLDLINQS